METKKLNQVIAQLKTRVAELESQLDLVEMDQGFLREELAELRAWKEASAPEQKHRS
jgi:septal ring factor EnvC (AmiA/AmiB activator)